jgi:hypothetical protein
MMSRGFAMLFFISFDDAEKTFTVTRKEMKILFFELAGPLNVIS